MDKKEETPIAGFIDKRAAGAKKIQKQAQAKGGPSLLTAVHFKAKEVPYNYCAAHCGELDKITNKADEAFEKIKNWKELTQREFQHYMGVLEAYGEIVIRIKKPNSLVKESQFLNIINNIVEEYSEEDSDKKYKVSCYKYGYKGETTANSEDKAIANCAVKFAKSKNLNSASYGNMVKEFKKCAKATLVN